MQPATLRLVPLASVRVAPALVGVLPLTGSMQPTQVAFALAPSQASHVVVVEVLDAHAVTNAEMSVGLHVPSCGAGVTNAGMSLLGTLDAGVGQTGPVPPLLDPELPPLLPELPPEL